MPGKKSRFDTITGTKHTNPLYLANQEIVKKLHEEDISNGYSYDKKAIDKASSVELNTYLGADRRYKDLEAGFFDPYEDYIDRGTLRGGQLNIDELNSLRAENQSNWEQAGNAIKRVGINVIPNIIGGFAAMVDIQGYWDAEHAANNSIVKWADEWQKETNEDYAIYLDNPGTSMDVGDFAWWMDRGSGLVTSVISFLAQGFGAGKVVSMGLKGLGSISRGKNLARHVLGKGAKGAERSKRLLTGSQGLVTSIMLNQSEAVIEATQVYQDTYDNSLAKGFDFKTAKENAARAAATTMNINRINILLNLTSARAFISPQSFSRQLIKNPTLARSLGLTALEGGQEAMEELINHVASKAGMAEGENRNYTFEDALNDINTMEGWEAAFLGTLGGIAQTGGTKILKRSKFGPGSTRDEDGNRISSVTDQRNKYQKQQEVIEELKSQGVNITDAMKSVKDQVLYDAKMQAAADKGDIAAIEALAEEMFEVQALKAFKSGTTEVLEQIYKEEAERDPEEVGQEHIDNAKQALKDLKVLEDAYVNHEDYANVDDIFHNRANKIRNVRKSNFIQSQEIETANEFTKLVKEIAVDYEVTVEREVIEKKEGEVVGKGISIETKPLSYSMNNLETNPEQTNANKVIYEKFLKEVKQLPQYKKDIQNKEQLDKFRKVSIKLEQEYAHLISDEVQAKARTVQVKAAKVKAAKSKLKDLDSIAAITKLKDDVADKEFSKLADEKISKINNDKNILAEKKKRKTATAELSTKIKNAKEEDYEALRKEIKNSELSKEYKDDLNLELDKRISGKETQKGETWESSMTATTPEEEAAAKANAEALETKFPKDVPNPNTEEENVNSQSKKIEIELSENNTTISGEDENGNLIYAYDKSTEGHNRGAHLTRDFDQISEVDHVSREEVTDEVIEGNKHLLDPDKFLAGTPLVMEVDLDYDGDKLITTSDERDTMSWRDRETFLINKYGEENYRQSQEYYDEAPIKVSSTEGEKLFYIHDTAWIRKENIDNTSKAIAEDKKKLRAIRKAIIDSDQRGIKSKITYKSYGKYFKTADGQKIDVSDAMPDTDLVFAIGKEGGGNAELVYSIPESQLKGGGKENVKLSFRPKAGTLYAIIPIGPDKSVPVPLERKTLDDATKDSIIRAIELYLEGDVENQVVKDILDKSNGAINITELTGLAKYLKQFIYLFPTDKNEGLSPFLNTSTDTINSALGLITVTGNTIEFGKPGVRFGNKQRAGTISKNFPDNKKGLDGLRIVLDIMLSNVDLKMLTVDDNSQAILINENDEVSSEVYTEYIKTTHKTNFISANIGTEEAPKWVYTIQPTILFDTKFAGIKQEAKKAKKKPTKKETAAVVKQTTKKKTVVKKKSKSVVVDYAAKKIPELKKILKQKGLPTKGKKQELIQRLQADDNKYQTKELTLENINKDTQLIYQGITGGFIMEPVIDMATGKTKDDDWSFVIIDSKGRSVGKDNLTKEELLNFMIKMGVKESSLKQKDSIEDEVAEEAVLSEEEQLALDIANIYTDDQLIYTLSELESGKQLPGIEDAEEAIRIYRKALEIRETRSKEDNQEFTGFNDLYDGDASHKTDGNTQDSKSDDITNNVEDDTDDFIPTSPIKDTLKTKKSADIEQKKQEELKPLVEELRILKEKLDSIQEDKVSDITHSITRDPISQKAAKKIIRFLSKRHNINASLVDMGQLGLYGDFNVKALEIRINKETYLNKDGGTSISDDVHLIPRATIFHEFIHPFVQIVEQQNPELYDEIYKKALEANKIEPYTNVDHYNKAKQKEELIVRYLDRLSKNEKTPTLLQNFLNWISEFFHSKRTNSKVNLKTLSSNTTVEELYDIFKNYGNLKEEVTEAYDQTNIKRELKFLDKMLSMPDVTKEGVKNYQEKIELLTSQLISQDISSKQQILKAIEKLEEKIEKVNASENIDDFIPELTEQQSTEQSDAVEESTIRGVDDANQKAIVEFLSAIIIKRSLKVKETTGKNTIDTKPLFDAFLVQLKGLKKFHEEKGRTVSVDMVQALIDQYSKVKRRVNEHLGLLVTGRIQEAELSDNELQGGLNKTLYIDDWAFTINARDTSSIDLKKFFSLISNREANGDNKFSSLGILEMVGSNIVYNTVQRILANKPADFDTMLQHLELGSESFPWLNSVIEQLKAASDKIKNEFVSNMSKHSIEMQFIMWSKDKDGSYSLQNWSSNSSSVQWKLLSMWQSNLKGLGTHSNLVFADEDSDYRFNTEVANTLINQATEWKKDSSQVTNDDLASWLGNFGIVLSDETYTELREGNYRNGGRKIVWGQLFKNKSSFIQVLNNRLKELREGALDNDNTFIMESAVKNLAKLDADNITNVFSNSFNAGGKTIYSYGNNNYLVNRMRDLREKDSDLIKDLQTISFTKDAQWLKDLTSTDEKLSAAMQSHFGVKYVSLEVLKKMYTESKDNRKLNNLIAAEHEVAKIAYFFSGSKFTDGEKKTRRKVSFFYPTMSDKTTMMLLQALSQELKLNNDGSLSDENIESLYTSAVLPEINRMMATKKSKNVAGYEPDYFFFFHGLNDLIVDVNGVERNLKDLIIDGEGYTPLVKDAIKEYLSETVDQLIDDKLEDWEKLGIGITDSAIKEKFSFLDKNYMSGPNSIAQGKNNKEKVRYAAADFVFNSLVANAEMHTMFIGDPALYAKFDSKNTLEQNLKATLINIGKRLAGDIAPGIELADNQNNKYHQVFFQDTKMKSSNVQDSVQLKYFSKIMKDFKDNYSNIEGSDAQEYTTWKEHLYVMKQLGRLTTKQYNGLSIKLASQSKNGVRENNKLSYAELGMVLQPMKPVYVGNQISVSEDIDRRVYIKSSSFPLIPQLTATMGIDSIRQALETFESDNNTTVRASFGTANKVGAIHNDNAIKVFNEDGSTKTDIKITEANTLQLDRKNFRIQQDIPYSREKDAINIGIQPRKLLFVDLLNVQIEDGVTGEQLKAEYDQYYKELFEDAQEKLKIELGLVDQMTIPAVKLQEILVREVKSRQGYPKNMLEALVLNTEYKLDENGKEVIDQEKSNKYFKIPLWASPYASKFESLITSIISKKVIKQKFPGHSYVLGSEEGFRTVVGEESVEELRKTSGIVFSKNFDPEQGLLPMRHDPKTKKMLPAQIMIPFKFRDENGNLLNVEDFIGEDGLLDTTKIPEKVLQLFGFRTPSQGRNSMSAVEIVGFLPEASGDLILAPRDWTKQMGSDFDVDKLYTYMYNTYYENGKLHTDFNKSRASIEKKIEQQNRIIEEVKEELGLAKEDYQRFDDSIKLILNNKEQFIEEAKEKGVITGDDNYEVAEIISRLYKFKETNKEIKQDLYNDLNEATRQLSILNRSYKASRQNAILDIHNRVMTSNNPEVIASIMALDSFGEFEELAADIQEIRIKKGVVKQHSTILSDSYQRMKYINANAGKNGVSAFSLDSSFNTAAQGKELVINNLSKEDKKKLPNPTYQQILKFNRELIAFGETISFGDLSNKYTLESQKIIAKAKAAGKPLSATEKSALKTKSIIIRTLQSTALDNEKAQLLDKLNINDETFDAIRALTLLGFEEKEIAAFLTQEIIWEYIEEVSNSRSSLTAFTPDAELEISSKLTIKYDPNGDIHKLSEEQSENLGNQSGEQLLNNIESKSLIVPGKKEATPEYNLQQILILEKFRKLTEIGKDIKKLQSAINSESNGVPNSLIETAIKADQIDSIGDSNIVNTENLLGEYEGGVLINPTTINGHAAFYGVQFANRIFDKYFPYKREGVVKVFDEIKMHLPLDSDIGTSKKADVHSDIFKGIRSYLMSSPDSGLFTESVNVERKRLFVDSTTNKSLALMIAELSEQSWFQSNGFLNKLTTDLNSNGEISRVNFESSAGENFDERNIHQGFNDLLQSNRILGKKEDFNGHNYTGRMLAQDLIMAAFLEGGNQGAKQYLKYVPVYYLKSMGFGGHLASSTFSFDKTFKGMDFEYTPIYTHPSEYAKQYIQNNPQKARSIELHQMDGDVKKLGDTFNIDPSLIEDYTITYRDELSGENITSKIHFLSVYDPKLPDRYALYEYSTVEKEYIRIPVAKKAYGFSQYNADGIIIPVGEKKKMKSTKVKLKPVPQQHPSLAHESVPVKPTKKFDPKVVNNNKPTETFKDLPIDIKLSGTKAAIDDLFNAVEDAPGVTSYNKMVLQALRDSGVADNLTIKYIDDSNKGRGSYNKATNTITYNIALLKNYSVNDLANIFIHELIHGATSRTIELYNTKKGRSELNQNTILTIDNLKRLQKNYIKSLKDSGDIAGLEGFKTTYWTWKYSQYNGKREDITSSKIKSWEKGLKTFLEGKEVSDEFPGINASDEAISKYYGTVKIEEFIAMALTDPLFQQHLNEVTDEDGVPWFTSLMKLINDLLYSLGFNVKRDSLLASAIDSSMELIRENDPNMFSIVPQPASEVEGENISSKGSVFAKKLTNPGNNLTVEYKGKTFRNSEHAYQTWKSGGFDQKAFDSKAFKPVGSLPVDNNTSYQTMVDILKAKLQQHPELVDGIIERGGIEYLYKSTHTVTGDKFWESSGQNQFMNALGDAFLSRISYQDLLRYQRSMTQPASGVIKEPKYELFPGVYANQGQREAIDALTEFLTSDNKAFLLQGKAGTGKTTIIKKIINEYKGDNILAIGPTHKAKKVLDRSLKEVDRKIPAVTLASALAIKLDEATGKFEPNEWVRKKNEVPIKKAKLIIIDEASMISDKLLEEIKEWKSSDAKIIFMGDRAQLPPVGQDKDSNVFNIKIGYELTEKMRQAKTSPIINIGSKVSANVESQNRVTNPIENSDRVSQIDPISGSSIVWENSEKNAITSFVADLRNADGNVNHAKIITFNNQNHNSPQSVKNINAKVRKEIFGNAVNNRQFFEGEMVTSYSSFSIDMGGPIPEKIFDNSEDFIITTVREVSNQTISASAYSNKQGERRISIPKLNIVYLTLKNEDGEILKEDVPVIANSSKEMFNNELQKLWKTDRQLAYALSAKIADLEYGYAITSHKAMGSTYENVYVMEDNIMGPSNRGTVKTKNQSLYVAVSRPKTKLVMVSVKNSGEELDLKTIAETTPTEPTFTPDQTNSPSQSEMDEYNNMRNNEDDLIFINQVEEYMKICKK